jgi:dTDP-4-amino-4,6-dideoxygalactose transaminase
MTFSDDAVDFNRPHYGAEELEYIEAAVARAHISSGGEFTSRCRGWLEAQTGSPAALLVHSCTAALEMIAMLIDAGPGDEIIMPSFTFVTTANAFALRGAVPVFVDIRPDTLNIDESLVERAITDSTKAIMAVHYSGVGCAMDRLQTIARDHNLWLTEDAAQGLMATYQGKPLGTIGQLGAISFHETKNVTCGEGGALLVNDPQLIERAEVLRDKGTNRSSFFRGQVDKYTWIDVGSSYALSDMSAAFLWAQLQKAKPLTRARLSIWERYQQGFAELEERGVVRRPVVPHECVNNAHMYYLLVRDLSERSRVLEQLTERGINAVFHYVPLHSSPAGRRYGRADGRLPITQDVSGRLLRLPLWAGMTDAMVDRVIEEVRAVAGPKPRGPRARAKRRVPAA